MDELIQKVEENSRNVGAEVSGIEKDEMDEEIEMPGRFFKAPTDELGDISRKLDKGVNLLGDTREGQDEGFNRLAEGQEEGFDRLAEGQEDGFTKVAEGQDRMVELLEKMVEE